MSMLLINVLLSANICSARFIGPHCLYGPDYYAGM